jgi:hypothetical protein
MHLPKLLSDTQSRIQTALPSTRPPMRAVSTRCAAGPPPPVGRIECDQLGNYIDNARLDYVVTDLTTGVTNLATTHPINSRYGFGGGFFGDYTDIAAGSDDVFHALWTDSNNLQSVVWFYGSEFVPTPIHQQDIATGRGNF